MTDLNDLAGRQYEAYLSDIRNGRIDTMDAWKGRIESARRLANGEFTSEQPGQTATTGHPYVMNLAEAMPRDVSRLVSESIPAVRAFPHAEGNTARVQAHVRETIGETYIEVNHGHLLRPQWGMDLIVAGAAFGVAWTDGSSEYPRYTRVDPIFCYPDMVNGILQNLLVVQRMKLRVAAQLWPDAGLLEKAGRVKGAASDEVEVWDFYDNEGRECIKAVSVLDKGSQPTGEGGVAIVERYEPKTNRPPAAMAQLPSHDGGFRGMLDQIGGSLEAKNRAVKYMIEYAHQQVFAPFEAKGIINPDDEPGPNTIYQHDPNVADSRMGRLEPAGAAPQLFALLQLLDAEQRGALAYPSARQGEVDVSIGSGSFLNASQGQLSTLVRAVQSLTAEMERELITVCFQLDEQFKNFEKPLIRAVGKKATYVPKKDIAGRYMVQVIHGAGAGVDRGAADVRVLQYKGAGLISDSTAREQIDFLRNTVSSEGDTIEQESTAKAILQRFLADPSTDMATLVDIYLAQADGDSFVEALRKIRERMEAEKQKAEQAAQEQAGGMLNTMSQPVEPGMEQQAMQAGGIPSQLPQELDFAPPPLEQVIVRN